MGEKYKICVLTYGKLYQMAQQVVKALEYEDTEVLIQDCNVETLPATVEQATAQGCEVFVAGAANAAEFSRCSHEHLVEIRLGNIDYLRAIKKAVQIGKHPAIAAYRYGRAVDLPLLEELSGISLELLLYEDSAELYHDILNTRADVIIGASHATEIAEELQKKNVLLYFSQDSIRSAIRRARLLAQDLHKNARNAKINQAIINYAPFGMAVTDKQGQVMIFNQTLRRQTSLEGARVQGRQLSELIPAAAPETFLASEAQQTDQRKLINGVMLRCVQTRIEDRGNLIGVLTTLYPDNSRRSRAGNSEAASFRAHFSWKDAVGNSPAVETMIRKAKTLAEQADPLIIEGEPGVGKNFFAQCIHNDSPRAKSPFITVNTAALPDQDAPRILFGSEDSTGVHPGLLELAQDGTIVLQELVSATPAVQSCILQVLTERQFRRLGNTNPIPFRARLMTVFNSGDDHRKIRENLWQRLSVFRLSVPPLREREEDLLALFARLSQENGGNTRRIGPESEQLLLFYSWPGNLAELSTVCKRYAFLLRQVEKPSSSARLNLLIQAIGEDVLFEEFLRRYPILREHANADPAELLGVLEQMKQMLKYNNDKLAEKLSLSRTTLWRMKKTALGEKA